MFAWIAKNAITIAALAVLLAVVAIAVITLIREKKRHPNGCTGNCSTCCMGCNSIKKG